MTVKTTVQTITIVEDSPDDENSQSDFFFLREDDMIAVKEILEYKNRVRQPLSQRNL